MIDYRLFTKRIISIGITNLLLTLNGIILLPILTKNLLIQEYGIWSQIMVTIGIIPVVATIGLPNALIRFLPSAKNIEETQEIYYSIYFMLILTSGIILTLFYTLSRQIAAVLFDNNIVIVKIVSLIMFIECLNYFCINYFRATQKIKKYTLLILLQATMNIVFVSFFVMSGRGIMGATIGLLLKGILICVIMNCLIFSEIGIKKPKFENIKEYFTFSLPIIPGDISNWIVDSSDRYVIGLLLGNAYVGYYTPAYSLGSLLRVLLAPISFILPPVLSQLYDANNINEVKKIQSYAHKYFLAIAIPSVFGITALSKPLLTLLTTSEIASQSYQVVSFVSASTMIFGAYTVVQQIIILEKRTKITSKIWIVCSVLNLSLNFILIPYMGITGAAFTTLIAFSVSYVLALYYSSRFLRFDINMQFILKSIFASIIISLIIVKFNPLSIYEILSTVIVCIINYLLILIILKAFKKDEINFFKKFIIGIPHIHTDV